MFISSGGAKVLLLNSYQNRNHDKPLADHIVSIPIVYINHVHFDTESSQTSHSPWHNHSRHLQYHLQFVF